MVHFDDGSHIETDVVLGADGIKSVVRTAVVSDQEVSHLSFSNTVAYRGMVSFEDGRASGVRPEVWQRPTCFVGKGKVRQLINLYRLFVVSLAYLLQHLIVFPIKGGTYVGRCLS